MIKLANQNIEIIEYYTGQCFITVKEKVFAILDYAKIESLDLPKIKLYIASFLFDWNGKPYRWHGSDFKTNVINFDYEVII